MGKCCFQVKFVQTDRQMDRQTTVKQYAPDLSMWGGKNISYIQTERQTDRGKPVYTSSMKWEV